MYDVCIIGGGINGAGIARDAAGRGFKVLLVEQGDLAQATSSASTKIIHGGLRYLEYYEFRLVRESLKEREVLMRIAPHLVRPLEYILPHDHAIRPYWLVRAGLYLYDFLAGKKSLPSSKALTLKDGIYGKNLKREAERGFSYYDCWGDDARLAALNAAAARDLGAAIMTRTKCTSIASENSVWTVGLETPQGPKEIKARHLVNAAGPWVREVLNRNHLEQPDTPGIRLVQGSHLIVPRLYPGDHAYMLQQPDGRIVFTIPHEENFTQIGTTDTPYAADPAKVTITAQEMAYLLEAANRYFKTELRIGDIVRTYSGVRPLFDNHAKDAKAVTRDYHLHEEKIHGAWLLSVFGGKLTTYRKLGEEVVNRLSLAADHKAPAWTASQPLPGGDFTGGLAEFIARKKLQWPKVETALLERYARTYGTLMDDLLTADPGADYGEGVCEAELRHLITREFAREPEDILWRRTKLGLHLAPATVAAIENALPRLLRDLT